MLLTEHLVRFCAVECNLQHSGELSVYYMYHAWLWSQVQSSEGQGINSEIIVELGRLIEPTKNVIGLRRTAVRIGGHWPPHSSLIPELIEELVRADEITHEEFFREFELIHPFVDGNGRVGQLLYNWRRGSLHDPVWAPNFFDDDRRIPGFGAPE